MTSDAVDFKQTRSEPHVQEGIPAGLDSAFTRREFVGIAAASLLMAGTLNGSAAEERKNGVHIGCWAEPVKRSQ